MALESVLSNLDSLDDSMKAHYSEVENVGFVLQTNNFVNDNVSYGNVDTKNLKSALDKEKAARKIAEKGVAGLEAYTALGTADEITQKLSDANSAGTKVDERIETLRTEYEGKITAAATTAAEAMSGMKQANHARELTSLLSANKADIKDGEGAQAYFLNIAKAGTAVDDNGNTVVINPDGTPRQTLRVDSVENMTLQEFWADVKGNPVHAFALAPSGASGSGSSGSSGGGSVSGTPNNATDWNKLSSTAQTEYYGRNPAHATELAQAGAKLS